MDPELRAVPRSIGYHRRMDLASEGPESKNWRALGILVMAGIALLQLGTEFFGTHDLARFLSKTAAFLLGLPVLVVCSFALFRWSAGRGWNVLRVLFLGAVGAGVFFALLLRVTRAATFALTTVRAGSQSYNEWDVVRVGFMNGVTFFALWALVFVLPVVMENARVRGLEAEKLRTEAELSQLRSHLEPHFLLNTLNAIAGLVSEDPRLARQLLGNLGDLLRDSVAPGADIETLEAQIEWLRRYARILETRHAGHLAFRWEIGDGTPTALLPRLLLQPLVENAVKHGALMRAGGGEIVVRTKLDGCRLVCTVEDNGPGIPKAATRPGAFGLVSVRRRLALRYSDAGSLRLESGPAGTRSIVELPVESGSAA
jgi:signal transduction histidine kinase